MKTDNTIYIAGVWQNIRVLKQKCCSSSLLWLGEEASEDREHYGAMCTFDIFSGTGMGGDGLLQLASETELWKNVSDMNKIHKSTCQLHIYYVYLYFHYFATYQHCKGTWGRSLFSFNMKFQSEILY